MLAKSAVLAVNADFVNAEAERKSGEWLEVNATLSSLLLLSLLGGKKRV